MDRGIPTEALLAEMRDPARQTFYLVGTPKGRVNQHEKKWLDLPWQRVRESVQVKLYQHEGELYVLAKSEGRQAKENAIRRQRLARLLRKLRALRRSLPKRDSLLLRLGAAKKEAGRAFGFVQIRVPKTEEEVNRLTFTFAVDKEKLRKAELRDGHYLLRSNLTGEDPGVLWERYVQLTQIEAAFKAMKSELGLRPIYHQLGPRVEAHILVAFLAYCLLVTLKNRLQALSQISIVYRAERQWRNQFRASLAVIVRKPSPTACSSAGRSRALAPRRNAFSLLQANSMGLKSGE
jgi:hypothetical protein